MPTAVATYVANDKKLIASLCRNSFRDFSWHFWDYIPGTTPLIWGWHLDLFCYELQTLAKRVADGLPKLYDLVINLPPGTSKSSFFSILFPAWVWTFMPNARFLMASHTQSLVLDLADKCRSIINSDLYRICFPEIVLEKDTAEYFSNTFGGWRRSCTVGGKSPMGFHAHFLCLPWKERVLTDRGWIPIGKIVDDKLQVKVAGYDHSKGVVRWQTIEAYEKNPVRPLWKVRFSNGNELEATEDHPVYVVGKGYVFSQDLCVGDEVICVSTMSKVRETGISTAISCAPHQNGVDFLLPRLPCNVYERRQTSPIQKYRETLRVLWETNSGGTSQKRDTPLLQLPVPFKSVERRKAPQIQKENRSSLRELWRYCKDAAWQSERRSACSLLFQKMCGHRTFPKNVRGEQSKLYSWEGLRPSIFWDAPIASSDYFGEGAPLLLSLWQDGGGKWEEVGSAPHRLGFQQPLRGELGSTLLGLSRRPTGGLEEKVQTCSAVVTSVERVLRVPETVYNLRVMEDSNYFAEGVLVHNCVDDPLNPQTVLSEAEKKTAAKFVTDDISTRKVDKSIAVTILVMQRLGVGDPSEAIMELSKKDPEANPVRHICLPAEIVEEKDAETVKPQHLKRFYRNGLMDPIRLGPEVLRAFKARGAHFYATQFLQRPYAVGGGMFKDIWFNQRVKAAPYDAQRIRYWDRACLVAGTGVVTKRGWVAIEDVVIGDEVLTRGDREKPIDYRRVLWSGLTKHASGIVTASFKNGSIVSGTEDHLVWTDNRGWVPLGSLIEGDRVISCSENANFNERVDICPWSEFSFSILRRFEDPQPVYDLEVEGAHEFFANGILVHNSTQDGGCGTAGVLMAKDKDGNFYVEHVEWGQWEPDTRNKKMRAIALRDRARYGPAHEPRIYVEAEGGSSGRDAWKGVVRSLAGFPVYEDRVTGSKEARAEPWSCQCAALNVRIVDDGTWDVNGYIEEHTAFPASPMKDRVDASTGAYNLLVGLPQAQGIRVFSIGKQRKGIMRVLVCPIESLATLVVEEQALLVSCQEPLFMEDGTVLRAALDPKLIGCPLEVPQNGLQKMQDSLLMVYADLNPANHQGTWNDVIPAYQRTCEEVILNQEMGKKLWSFLLKKRDAPFEVIVFCDEGKDQSLSLAMAVCDLLYLKREDSLHVLNYPEKNWNGAEPPNPHAYAMVKATRVMVVA